MNQRWFATVLLFVFAMTMFPSGPLAPSAQAQSERDVWLWPFAQDSIWNMPIGSDADYQSPGHFPAANYVHSDDELHYKTYASDPLRTIYSPGSWTNRCSGTTPAEGDTTMHIPDDLIVADAITTGGVYETPNNVAAFLKPDGRTLLQLEPLCRNVVGGPVYGYQYTPDQDIYGPGIYGTHWGSGLSGFGGTLRHGELTGTEPLRHALKLNVWGTYLYYNSADATPGYRWPADRADAGAPNNYHGSNPKIEMGALMAILPSASESSLGLKTEAGKKIFHALQDYGAYIVDDSGWDAYAFSLSREARYEFEEFYGYSFNQGSGATGAAKDWFDDFNALVTALYVVDNSGPNSIGGGGSSRRAALAPPIASSTDTTAPSTPANLNVTSRALSSIGLSWSAASDNVRVMSYEIFNGSTKVGETFGKTSTTISGLTPNTSYSFSVKARDTGTNLSAASNTVNVSTYDGYEENFDDGSAQGWTLSDAIVEYGRLKLTNWSGAASGIYNGANYSGSYTYRVALQTDAADDYGKTRVFFNYSDASNNYFVEIGGGSSNSVTLKKSVSGTTTTLATYNGSFAIRDWDWPIIEVRYSSGSISVSGIRGGSTTALFNNIQDSSHSSGKIGVGVSGTQSFADNAGVVLDGVTAYAEDFGDGSAQGWSSGSVEYGYLKLTNWGGASTSIYNDANYSGSYTYRVALQTDSGDNNGKTRVFFNYSDASNNYFVEIGGGSSNSVTLKKVVGGSTTTLATYNGSFAIRDWDWPIIEVRYSSGSISVSGIRGGSTTALFNNIQDSSHSSGKIGVGVLYTQSFADNVSVD